MNLSAAETAEYPEISPPLTGGDSPCGIIFFFLFHGVKGRVPYHLQSPPPSPSPVKGEGSIW